MSQMTASAPRTSVTAAVQLLNVSRTYGRGEVAVQALRGVTLDIAPDSFVVFLGSSGSGKTTLLNLVGGMESPTDGRVVVAGEDITGRSASS